MYRSLFPLDIVAELSRLQRETQQAFDLSPTIRGFAGQGFPALNVGSTPQSLEIYAFAPGVDPASLEVNLEKGLLTISGERKTPLPDMDGSKAALHINERFSGRFHRALTLSEDADPDAVQARMSDGVLRISIRRRASAQPRRIEVN